MSKSSVPVSTRLAGIVLVALALTGSAFAWSARASERPLQTAHKENASSISLSAEHPTSALSLHVGVGGVRLLTLDSSGAIVRVERNTPGDDVTTYCQTERGESCPVTPALLAAFEQLRPQLAPGAGVVFGSK